MMILLHECYKMKQCVIMNGHEIVLDEAYELISFECHSNDEFTLIFDVEINY